MTKEPTTVKMQKLSHCNFTFLSKYLNKQTSVNVLLPFGCYTLEGKKTAPPYKVIWLLHGMSDDYNTWMRCGIIENLARDFGIAVVMPDGANSFYTNMMHGPDYYSYITEELPQVLDGIFNFSDKREDNFIAGFSMGGYGALKIGLLNSQRFSAIGAFSPVADVAQLVADAFSADKNIDDNAFLNNCASKKLDPHEVIYAQEFRKKMFLSIWGDNYKNLSGSDDDLFAIFDKAIAENNIPDIYMACGLQDSLIKSNEKFYNFAKDKTDKIKYDTMQGGHFWDVWNKNIEDYFCYLHKQKLI